MDIKHVFSRQPSAAGLSGAAAARRSSRRRRSLGSSSPAGLQEIGHPGTGFAFDNERPRHKVWLEPFRLAARPVTCGEYLGFIEDGGYRRPEFWLSDGWATVCAAGLGGAALLAPRSRRRMVDLYAVRAPPRRIRPSRSAMSASTRPTPSPSWAGKRLPTEAEWEIAAAGVPVSGNFADRGHFHPCARLHRRRTSARAAANVRRRLGMDGEPLYRLSPLSPGRRRDRRIQRQIHVQPDGAARRRGGHARRAYAGHLPQFLPALGALGVRRVAAGGGH